MKNLSILLITVLTSVSLFSKHTPVPTDIFYAIAQNDRVGVCAWAVSKPDLAVRDQQGYSALIAAVVHGNLALVRLVLKTKIDVNLLDHAGKTALDWACESSNEKIIFSLIKHGAKVTSHENESWVITLAKRRAASIFKRGLFCIFVVPLAIAGLLLFGIWAEFFLRPYIGYRIGLALLSVGMYIGTLTPIAGLGMTMASTPWYVRSRKTYMLESTSVAAKC